MSAGGNYADERVLADLRTTANAPLFGPQSVMLGTGIVGGTLMANDQTSRNIADAAIRLLNGEPPGSIQVPPQSPGPPLFDWRELQRWGIPESRLRPGSIVRYRAPSLWQAYRGTVLTTVGVLAVQSLLIVGLLYQRRARQRAESDSRRNLALAADASRRETMSALTNSIGHELGQPLGSIVSNAQALQMMVTANRATSETIGEILSDIQTQGVRATQIIDRHRTMLRSHQLDKKPIDLHAVIDETLALVAHDMTVAPGLGHRQSVVESVRDRRRSGALAAGARELGGERHGRDGRHAAGPSPCHDQQRRQSRRCRRLGARHGTRLAGTHRSIRCSHHS